MSNNQSGFWRVMHAGIAGASHADGQSQDAHGWSTSRGWLLLVASDGIGSEPLSGVGSRLAVATVLGAFERDAVAADPDERSVRQWIGEAHDALIHEAAVNCHPVHLLGCTLLVMVADAHKIFCGQLGDGYCVRGDGENTYQLLIDPVDLGAANLTHTLCDPSFREHIRSVSGEAPLRIALLTDGLDMHTFDHEAGAIYGAFFDALFPHLEANNAQVEQLNTRLAAYLNSVAVAALCRDDKTLLLATRAFDRASP